MNILSLCDNGDILSIFGIVNTVVNIIKIVVPIILILSLMIDYTKAVSNSDNDALAKVNRTAVSKVVAAILVFYIPTFVALIADISSYNKNNYLSCLSAATPEKISQAYENAAQKYLDMAKNDLTDGSYMNAQNQINKLKDKASKERLSKELAEVKKAIDEKRKKAEEERESHQKYEQGWWFPIGSATTTTKHGKLFAPGDPVGTALTAHFGGNDKVHKGLGGGHGAIDIGVGRLNYVIASRSGTVTFPRAGDRIDHPDRYIKPDANGKYDCTGLQANMVVIDHGDGYVTEYGHLYKNTITVRAGEKVEQGQVIGKIGSSGCSTGPHLHFEIHENGRPVDPEDYVDGSNPRP